MTSKNLSAPEIAALRDRDARHVWHPYAAVQLRSYSGFSTEENSALLPLVVTGAEGVELQIADGRRLIDGMSSWWAVIHGYNHPVLNQAAMTQISQFSHVMFGGLTHQPAIELAELLVEITPTGLEHVFFSDSGSVSVEVAYKMAVQYWRSRGEENRTQLMTWRGGYHGDTFTPMSVCDPEGGMHSLWSDIVRPQVFVEAPPRDYQASYLENFAEVLNSQRDSLAAVIIEPIVQGAGGMNFHDPQIVFEVVQLCRAADVLVIFDEIATGFGRTGTLFAADRAGVSPDIMCLGKALTGGYLSLAATLCTAEIAATIAAGDVGILAHGPTFMANPLACAVALASTEMLLSHNWQEVIAALAKQLNHELAVARDLPGVREVRVLGAIAVIELENQINIEKATAAAISEGVWLRPFRNLIYAMPPYICSSAEITKITTAMIAAARASN